MQGRPAADHLLDAHHALGGGPFDIDDVIPLALGQIDGFLDLVPQPGHDGPGQGAEILAALAAGGPAGELAAKAVVTRLVALDEAILRRRRQDAEGGGGVQARLGGEHLETGAAAITGKGIQEGGQAVYDLNAVAGGAGLARGWAIHFTL